MESKRNRIVGAFWFIYIILLNFSASLSGWILFPWYDCWSCGTWIDIWRFVYGVGNWQFSLEKSSNSICICNLHTAYNNNNTLSTCKCKSLWNIPSVHIHRTVDRVKMKLLILFICGLYSSCFPLASRQNCNRFECKLWWYCFQFLGWSIGWSGGIWNCLCVNHNRTFESQITQIIQLYSKCL